MTSSTGITESRLTNGADDRPYMRGLAMPKFGNGRLAKLHETLIAQDEKTGAPAVTFEEPSPASSRPVGIWPETRGWLA